MFEKVLVTGANGLLGAAVVREMAGRAALRGFDLTRGNADIDWQTGDLTDADAVARAVEGQDAIIQIAAVPNIWSGGGERIMQVNITGLYLLLSAAEAAGVRRVVICSSDSVLGYTVREGKMLPPQYLPADIAHPLNPTDPYALSKLMGEEMGRSFANRGMEIVALRPVFIAYPEMYGEIRARAAAPDSYRGRMAGGPSSAGGGPCWHHVGPRDIARAFRLALELKQVSFERFVISANVTLSPEPTLERLARLLGGRMPVVRRPEVYARNPFAPLYDLDRSREVLGFDAQFDARADCGLEPIAIA
ncbi:NAD(P)-dependent oxidoreductase [Xanthobacter autotrophicus DSM 431]|uniref:NAD-dependent epimerase/dehydratase family protein n=1 Tax=Xanthobacter nonsaccharivorans TaxID=3119912 RepID=UPI00372C37FE